MKQIIIGVILSVAFIGCSSKTTDDNAIEAKIVVGKSIANLKLNDQFEKPHTIDADTKKIVFAFAKEPAHICNDFFATKKPTYLADNNTQFIADVSAAPSLIRSFFIMPGLKEFKHTVMIFQDKTVAAPFKKGLNIQTVTVVYIDGNKIIDIKMVKTDKELATLIEN